MKHANLFKKLALLSALAASLTLQAAEGTLPIPLAMSGNADRQVPKTDINLEVRIDDLTRITSGTPSAFRCNAGEQPYLANGEIVHRVKAFDITGLCLSGTMQRGSMRILGANLEQTVKLTGNLSSTSSGVDGSFSGDMEIANLPGVPSSSGEAATTPTLLKFQLRMVK